MAHIISKAESPAAFNLGEKVVIELMGRYQSKGGNRESEKENREKRDAQQCMIVDIRLGQDGQHVYGVAYQNGPIVERNVPEGRLQRVTTSASRHGLAMQENPQQANKRTKKTTLGRLF